MNRKNRLVTLFTSTILSMGMLVGCSQPAPEKEETPELVDINQGSVLATKLADTDNNDKITVSHPITLHASTSGLKMKSDTQNTLQNVQYVMIYNPFVMNNDFLSSQPLSTGGVGEQILTGMNRSGGLGEDFKTPTVFSTEEINKDLGLDQGTTKEMRGGLDPVYSKGDVHDFYVSATLSNRDRELKTFDCVYEGKNCYVWSYNGSISDKDAQRIADEFDNKIYPLDTQTFGQARFTENGGKVNMLFHPFAQDGLLGLFSNADIYASGELSPEEEQAYKLNTDHAIINMNSLYLDSYFDVICSTTAHEFQHLICASECFYNNNVPIMQTWLNEAMSAYAEDLVYPGIKEQNAYNELLYVSNNYRTGQSLYNFSTANDEYIGAYGAVYLYAKYAAALGGDNVFSNIHAYWRQTGETVNESESLVHALPSKVVKQINNAYEYSPSIRSKFKTAEEEWMSKLTLDFYLETLSMDLANLESVANQARMSMLYSDINPAMVEPGGRIIVAVNGSEFTIPSDSDLGLIYIGLDKDFNVVSSLVTTE